jgi:glucosamine-phosphate N-acetyltransferase
MMNIETLKTVNILDNEKFIIENINNSVDNFSYENLKNLISVLEQLTVVKLDDISKLRDYLLSLNVNTTNKKYILVIKYDGQIIGTGSILIENKIIHNMGKVGHIEDVVIDSEFRNKGFAKKLITELIQIAKENECYKVILDASNNVTNFYEKCGFKKNSNNMRFDI